MLIAGDLNADPAVVPCLAKGISAGKFVDLALAYSLGLEGSRTQFASSSVRIIWVLGGILLSVVLMRWLRLMLALALTGGSLLISQCLLALILMGGRPDIACPQVCQPVWPACRIDTPDRSSSSVARVVQDAWDAYRDELAAVPPDVVLALRDAASRSCVDDFWIIWSKSAEAGLFRAYCWSTLSTLPFLPFSSFGGVKSPSLMCSRGFGILALPRPGGRLF